MNSQIKKDNARAYFTRLTYRERLKWLNDADYTYWTLNEQCMTDIEYDTLVSVITEEDGEPSAYKYEAADGSELITHVDPMHSLIRGYDIHSVTKWLAFLKKQGITNVSLSLKVDGVAYSAIYNRGRLISAATRGTGTVGHDITNKMVTMGVLPHSVKESFTGEVRGELYVSRSDFISANLERDRPYPTARHAAAGILSKGQGRLSATIYYTDLVSDGEEALVDDSRIMAAKILGLQPLHCIEDTSDVVNALIEFRDSLLANGFQDVPYDGIVLTVANVSDRERSKGKNWYKPRHSFAYKLPSATVEATIAGTGYSIGASGNLVPKAYFDDVLVGTYTVSELTLYNEAIRSVHNYYVGKKVYIELTGDTVVTIKPHADSKMVDVTNLEECPFCRGPVVLTKTFYICKAPKSCAGAIAVNLERFFGRKGVNCKGLGAKAIVKLVGHGCITPADVFHCSTDFILSLPNGSNVRKSLIACKGSSMSNILYGMNIDGVGQTSLMKMGGVNSAMSKMNAEQRSLLSELSSLGFININI